MWRHPLDAETGCKYNVPALKGVSSADWTKAGAFAANVGKPILSRPSNVTRRLVGLDGAGPAKNSGLQNRVVKSAAAGHPSPRGSLVCLIVHCPFRSK